MTTVVLDNYDSFTYNLVYLLKELSTGKVDVIRNNEITPEELLNYDQIVLSPGPGIPQEAGILCEAIETCYKSRKILGVCLGHQAIAEVFGGTLKNMSKVMHGVATPINLSEDPLFEGLNKTIEVGRYHSWIASDPLPEELSVIARDGEGQIMALKHKTYAVYGVQFHPESILTPDGKNIIKNWLAMH
jgi:anthranilate synthase component 2